MHLSAPRDARLLQLSILHTLPPSPALSNTSLCQPHEFKALFSLAANKAIRAKPGLSAWRGAFLLTCLPFFFFKTLANITHFLVPCCTTSFSNLASSWIVQSSSYSQCHTVSLIGFDMTCVYGICVSGVNEPLATQR